MQGTWVQNLFQEDPIYCVATKPMHPQLLNTYTATTEAHALRVYAPQQKKPL